jgi:RHS repeat-associated protein
LADAFPRLLGENYPATGQLSAPLYSALHFGLIFPRMKTSSTVVVCLAICMALFLAAAQAQNTGTPGGTSQSTGGATQLPAPTPYQVVESGLNYNVWQGQTYEVLGNGQTVAHTHQFTELASGLNYQTTVDGPWLPSQELIEPSAGGAVAQQGQSQIIFANNLNTADAIDMQGPGVRLRSNVIGLMYYDPITGQAVEIGQLQDTEGQLISANQVLYTNAFTGVNCDVQYTYRISGLEQDVIVRQQLPTAESFGLNSQNVELEVITEFDAPVPDLVADRPMTGTDLEADQNIVWGAVSLGDGKAFILGDQYPPVKVIKRYVEVEGTWYLQEKVRLADIQPALAQLPEQAANETHRPTMVAKNLVFPKFRPAQAKARPMRVALEKALGKAPAKGYVMDYVTLSAGGTNYTFQGDTSYYVSGSLVFYGTNTFEAGTVIKCATGGGIEITPGAGFSPGINWGGSAFRPVVFSAKDDNTVGESFGSGTPSGYYGNPMLYLDGFSPASALTGLRFSYASTGIQIAGGGSADLYSAQFVNCQNGLNIAAGNAFIGNGLFAGVKTNFIFGGGATVNAQNVTFSRSAFLATASAVPATNSLTLTNCILANVTNLVSGLLVSTNGNYNGFYQSPYLASLAPTAFTNTFYPFQTAGAGSYYQVTNSAFIGVGTAGLDANLLVDLTSRTVYPPLICSNFSLSVATNYYPQVPRDTNASALGFHYDCLDYAFGGVNAYSNLTFNAGTAMGWFELPGTGGAGYGISIYDKVVVRLNGTASQPCIVARYDTVQEGGNGLWMDKGYLAAITGQSLSGGYGMSAANAAQVWPNFTRHAGLAADPNHYREENALIKVVGQNSEFWSANIGAYWVYLNFTNCLFDRSAFVLLGSNPAICGMRNCTMHGGSVTLEEYGQTWPVWIEECAFDGTSLSVEDNSGGNTNLTYCDFNAFVTSSNRLPMLGTHDVIVTNFNWQRSWFGNFYLPTNSPLINAGSTTADKFGLYHFTTQTNQVPETNSVVDIAYHYVATDANGNPLDSNGDGVPNYIEDANGDGLVDDGETNWALAILSQPTNQTALVDSIIAFGVVAGGTTPISYQWSFNGTNLPGQTYPYLIFGPVQESQAGNYSVVVTNNLGGAITSTPATLTVCTPTINTISNLTVTAGSGPQTITLTGISAGCSAYQVAGITASSSSTNIVSNPTINYFSPSNTGTLTFTPSATSTGAVYITVTLQDTQNTNCINGEFGFTGSLAIDPTYGLGSLTNFITTNCVLTAIGAGYFTNLDNLTNSDQLPVLQPLIFNPPTLPVPSFMMFTNGGKALTYDAWLVQVYYQSEYDLMMEVYGMVHLEGFQDTPGLVSFNCIGAPGSDWGYLTALEYLGGLNQLITSFQITVVAPTNIFVIILSPTNQTILARTNVILTAFATNSVPGQPVNWVQFFVGTNAIGSAASTNNIYQLNWYPTTGGTDVITALAANTNGQTGWSSPVTNYVRNLPSVSITNPANGYVFAASPTNITLQATATAYGATITNVAFYCGTTNLGSTSAGPPWTSTWMNIHAGIYTLGAKAVDSTGATGISSNILITVEPTNRPPSVFVGPNETNYLSTNAFLLAGLVSDDGLPAGSTLTVLWTNLSSGTNVTFVNSNLPVTSAFFWATGVYTLQLSANDSQFTTRSNLTVTVLPANQPPMVSLATNYLMVILPATNNDLISMVTPTQIPIQIPNPVGLDYFIASNCLITSINSESAGLPYNLELVSATGTTNQFTSISNLTDEVYIATVRNTLGGFRIGEMFCGAGSDGEIIRIEPDGSTIGTNGVHGNAWVVLPSVALSNGVVVTPGLLRGGLWVDRTGVWGGDLIVSTLGQTNTTADWTPTGDVWRVNSAGQATFVAQMNAVSPAGDSFEGVTTCPNDVQKYGPWAGRILVGSDFAGDLFAIDTNGFVVRYGFPFGAEDIRVIPQNENFFGCDDGTSIWGIPASQFTGMVGDILIADEGDVGGSQGGYLYRVSWNGTNFNSYRMDNDDPGGWEGINFVPAGLLDIPPAGVPLNGVVIDDGELFAPTSNIWTVVSGPGPVTIGAPTQTNTIAEFSVPGDYVLSLSAYDGQYTTSSNVTIQVVQNQPPTAYAGTNQFLASSTTTLNGVVSDDGLPYGETNIVWSLIGWPPSCRSGFQGFSSSNALNPTISFDTSSCTGTYTFLLTVDDGQATNWSEVTVTVESPTLLLTPSYGIATGTNTPFTVTARLLDVNGNPLAGTNIDFSVAGGPDQGTNGSVVTDINGYALFTYTNTTGAWHDTITATAANNGATVYSTPGEVLKDWATNINCGDVHLDQALGAAGGYSREWTNYPADYYVFNGTAGDSITLAVVQRDGPLFIYLRNPSDQLVAATPLNYDSTNTISSLNYPIATSGDYVIEVLGAGDTYDFYLTCASEVTNPAPDLQVWFNGTNVPNGGNIVFPPTTQGVATNIVLSVTNTGNVSFTVTDLVTYGNFTIPDYTNVLSEIMAPGTVSNLTVTFNAATNGLSWGAVTMAPNYYPAGSNYTVYFMANTFPTGAAPAIQITSPASGSTFVYGTANDEYIPFTAAVTPGSAEIVPTSVKPEIVLTNGESWPGYSLSLDSNNQTYTNSFQPIQLGGIGDYTFTVVAADQNGQSAMATPILIHIIPYDSPSPRAVPQIAVLYNGTIIPSSGTILFPQTVPGAATNISLIITNPGSYPLDISDVESGGDFTLTNNVLYCGILPGASTNLGVVFNASASGQAVGELSLGNNASSEGYYTVSFIGDAYPPGYVPPATNGLPPVAVADQFGVPANSVNNILDPLANDYDTNNYPLTIVATTPSEGGTVTIVNHGTAISYTPPPGIRSVTNNGVAYPADGFNYTISDGHGGTASAVVSIIINASDIPQMTLTASNYSVTAGTVDPITATVTPSENIVKVDFYLGEDWLGEATNGTNGVFVLNWTAIYDGSDKTITASATDKFGQVGVAPPITVSVTQPPGSGQIIANLDHLADSYGTTPLNATNLVTIRDGIFNLYGQAYHSLGSNVVWQLGVYTIDGTLVRDLTPATTTTVGSATATNLLEACDLSTLMNGVYVLTLSASGGYMVASTSVQFRLESNLKIGQFSFSQQDLVIPVNGIPLTVTRTYNSINPGKGDFGYGWTYALSDMNASLDETRSDVTDLDGNTFSQRSGGSWDVTLTLPNGQTTTFAFNLEPGNDGTYYANWQPAPGITAKLELPPGVDNRLETLLGNLENDPDLYYWDAAGPETPMNDYDFPGFVLTTLDGTQYAISREDLGEHFIDDGAEGYYVQAYGNLSLSQITERSLDTIAISPSSIVYTATNGATREVLFQRNSDGLISAISDPNGLSGGSPVGPPTVQYEYDSSDNLINVLNLVDSSGAGTYVTNSFSYTNASFLHYITGIVNADGTQVAKNFYDDSGKLIAVQDAEGNLTQFIHNLTNDMDVIIDRLGHTNTYVYDPRGNVTAQTNQLGQITEMAYDVNNNKTNEVVFLNNLPYATNSYVYDTNLNLMLVSTDPLGNINSFAYDSDGNLLTNTDAKGNSTINLYDGNGNLVQTTDALNHNTYNFYNGGLMLGSQDAVGSVTTNYYDPGSGYLTGTAVLDGSGVLLSSNAFAYDENGNRTNSTVWRTAGGSWTGATTVYVYDAMNRVVQTIDPDGGTNTVVYNAIGKQQATIDALGNTTSYVYDSQGRLVQTVYADGTTEQSVYDANGNRVQSIDRANRITGYVYDALNRLVQTVYPDNTTSTTVYDGVGRVAQTVDARGAVTAFAYDAAGRRLAVTNAVGTAVQTVSAYGYDADGNQTTFTDALTHVTTSVFDALNRQLQDIYPDGTTTATAYDADGRRVAGTNQDGIVTLFGYDGAGRLTSVTNALNQVTRYQYDEAGNEVAQIDALNRTNRFVYDGLGRRVLHARPDGIAEGFNYDADGNLTAHTNYDYIDDNSAVFNRYDVMNRVTNSTDIYHFDYSYSYTATGQRQSMADYYGAAITFAYDNRDRLVQKVVVWNSGSGPTASLNYGYDANGNVTSLVSGMANGVNLAYGYDALNRLTNVLSHGQLAAGYAYDLAGNLQELSYGNGVTNLYQYDALNRLTNQVWKLGGSARANFAYQILAGGTRTNLSEAVNGTSRTYGWSYDHLYRLTNEVVSGLGNVGYAYDPVGNRTNRTSSISGLAADSYNYDTNDELSADSTGSYTFDVNGNTETTPGGAAIYYDALNHLTSTGNTNFTYDGDGNRVSKQVLVGGNWPMRYYLVDDQNPSGYAQVLEEYQTDFNLTGTPAVLSRVYNYGLNLISQQQFNTNTLLPSVLSYYGYDGHGSVRFLMDTNGGITDTYTYDAYGVLITSSGSTPNNYLYCGQQYDSDLGLYYNRARYLNTGTGRFWSRDTTEGNNEDPMSLHKYLYCQDNPMDNVDPSGHDILSAQIGTAVHQYIGRDFVEKVAPYGISGPSVVNILLGLPGFTLPPKLQGVVTALFPDLVDVNPDRKEVYEIKPNSILNFALAEAQLEGYVDLFNTLDKKGGWHAGTGDDYTPPRSFELITPVPTVVVVQRPVFGVILYSTLQQFVNNLTKNVGEEEEADMDESVDEATENAAEGVE